jgi:PBP1b-binding outer membrane lipoprotein LpoB|tara:strand:- start:827 stop:1021 length:195 start_codon:yes stop_codon:yes gene_type:complete
MKTIITILLIGVILAGCSKGRIRVVEEGYTNGNCNIEKTEDNENNVTCYIYTCAFKGGIDCIKN